MSCAFFQLVAFPVNIYVLSIFGAAAASALAVPWLRSWCLRSGLVDAPGPRKIHNAPIPLAGGWAVLTGVVLPWILLAVAWRTSLLSADAREKISYGIEHRSLQLGVVLLGAVGMVVLGWIDDKRELKPGAKFAGQFTIALLVAAAGVRITLFIPNLVFSYLITIFWILTLINAFNFMDNMNGLCAGLGFIGALYFGTIAAWQGQYLVAALAFLSAGSLLGFMPFNFPRASVFLGDAGSHLVGYLMAVLAILPHFYSAKHPNRLAVLSPLFILAVPLMDLAWVVLLRWRLGKPFYIGDTNHLSHRLVRCGLTPTCAVLCIWIFALLLGSVSFLLQYSS